MERELDDQLLLDGRVDLRALRPLEHSTVRPSWSACGLAAGGGEVGHVADDLLRCRPGCKP